MKVVINKCYGGFGLSNKAYEKLIEYGVPVRKYIEQKRGEDGLYLPEPLNEGEVIFNRSLQENSEFNNAMAQLTGNYWDDFLEKNRSHPLLIRVVEELGQEASGRFANLKIVEIPDGMEFTIEEYDGQEHVAETHKTFY